MKRLVSAEREARTLTVLRKDERRVKDGLSLREPLKDPTVVGNLCDILVKQLAFPPIL